MSDVKINSTFFGVKCTTQALPILSTVWTISARASVRIGTNPRPSIQLYILISKLTLMSWAKKRMLFQSFSPQTNEIVPGRKIDQNFPGRFLEAKWNNKREQALRPCRLGIHPFGMHFSVQNLLESWLSPTSRYLTSSARHRKIIS